MANAIGVRAPVPKEPITPHCGIIVASRRFFFLANGVYIFIFVQEHKQTYYSRSPTGRSANPPAQTKHKYPPSWSRESLRACQFVLWQVIQMPSPIRSLNGCNSDLKGTSGSFLAKGCVAVVLQDGHGSLLSPTDEEFTSSDYNREADEQSAAYNRVHLHMKAPTWSEQVRWRSDDPHFQHLKFIERDAHLYLFAGGLYVTIYKVLEDEVRVHFHKRFSASEHQSTRSIDHFSVAESGEFVATASTHDRIVKLWSVGYSESDDPPTCSFIPHTRAVVQMRFIEGQHRHTRRKSSAVSTRPIHTLCVLDRSGTITLWGESTAHPKTFIAWKSLSNELNGSIDHHTATCFGLVNHLWTQRPPRSFETLEEALLDEENVISSLSREKYGIENLASYEQVQGLLPANSNIVRHQLKGEMHPQHQVADTAYASQCPGTYLLYAVRTNGHLALYRVSSTSAVASTSLLLEYDGLEKQLADAIVYDVNTPNYRECDQGSSTFVLEVVFQPKHHDPRPQIARLKLHAYRAPKLFSDKEKKTGLLYSVQQVQVTSLTDSILQARKVPEVDSKSMLLGSMIPSVDAKGTDHDREYRKLIVQSNVHGLDLMQGNDALTSVSVVSEKSGQWDGCVWWKELGMLIATREGKLYARELPESDEEAGDTVEGLVPLETDDECGRVLCLSLIQVPSSLEQVWSNPMMQTLDADEKTFYRGVIGLEDGTSIIHMWILTNTKGDDKSSLSILQKTKVTLPTNHLLRVCSVQSTPVTSIMFMTMDTKIGLDVWTFPDTDDLSTVQNVHHMDLAEMIKTQDQESSATKNQWFRSKETKAYTLQDFKSSLSGKVAIALMEEGVDATRICVFSAFEVALECCITLTHKSYGVVSQIEWGPPTAAGAHSQLVFVSTTMIGCMTRHDTGQWQVVYTSKHDTDQPLALSPLSYYPKCVTSRGELISTMDLEQIRSMSKAEVGVSEATKKYWAHHPVLLLSYLMSGSFTLLQHVLDHWKTNMEQHESNAYLQMTSECPMQELSLLPISTLLDKVQEDAKSKSWISNGTTSTSIESPARASDLFAMDRDGRTKKSEDRADMLFAPTYTDEGSTVSVSKTKEPYAELVSSFYSTFFRDRAASLSFLTDEETRQLCSITDKMGDTIRWSCNDGKDRDEASRRFLVSTLWEEASRDGICSERVAWAAMSQDQDALLSACFPQRQLTWSQVKYWRLPFWIQRSAALEQVTQRVAQTEFTMYKDPFQVAVFYVLLGKTKLLASLFKMADEGKIHALLMNDFTQDRWQKAAIKNAYVLKTKQKYTLSAAFFLLGGRLKEAVYVAEQADQSLCLSLLIARVMEKADFEGCEANGSAVEVSSFITGMSSSLRQLDQTNGESKVDLTQEFWKDKVDGRAKDCNDVYMQFLVRYVRGDKMDAVRSLLTIDGKVHCIFDPNDRQDEALYWRTFGQSLLGACELVRVLKSQLPKLSSTMKGQILRLQAITQHRLHNLGLDVLALLHATSFGEFFQQVAREQMKSVDVPILLGYRFQVLMKVGTTWADSVSERFEESLVQMLTANKRPDKLEDAIDKEIHALAESSSPFSLMNHPETQTKSLEMDLRVAVIKSLERSDRLSSADYMVSYWMLPSHTLSKTQVLLNPVRRYIDQITDGIEFLMSGNFSQPATNALYATKVEETSMELLDVSSQLLQWLSCYYSKPIQKRSTLQGSVFVRVVAAAIYCVLSVCCRYLKCPSCMRRALHMIFPHKQELSADAIDKVADIALAEVCIHCNEAEKLTSASSDKTSEYSLASCLWEELPRLYQMITTMKSEVSVFASEVKTRRVGNATSPLFSYCQYWGLLLTESADKLPKHLENIAMDGYQDTFEAVAVTRRLLSTWSAYRDFLSLYGSKGLLDEFVFAFIRDNENTPPVHLIDEKQVQADIQPVKCSCSRCPWRVILELFVSSDRLSKQLTDELLRSSQRLDKAVQWEEMLGFSVSSLADKLPLSPSSAQRSRIQLTKNCVYKNEGPVRSLCFNMASDNMEMVVCGEKGICRTSNDPLRDSMYQFKGMFTNPNVVGSLSPSNRVVGSTSLSPPAGRNVPIRSPTKDVKALPFKPSAVASHPTLPFFASGDHGGRMHLWSFESLSPIHIFPLPLFDGSKAANAHVVRRLQFDGFGRDLAAMHSSGYVSMYKPDHLNSASPSYELQCHDKSGRAISFLHQPNIIATAGLSSEKRNVALWDLLQPASSALIASPVCHPAGATSLTFASSQQLLLSGGENGEISFFDVRQQRVLHTISAAHDTPVTMLTVHPSGSCVLSGSAAGDVKIWALSTFREVMTEPKLHAKTSFFSDAASSIFGSSVSSVAGGVCDAVATQMAFFSGGADGSVHKFDLPSMRSLV